jgi:hypothetical protein
MALHLVQRANIHVHVDQAVASRVLARAKPASLPQRGPVSAAVTTRI